MNKLIGDQTLTEACITLNSVGRNDLATAVFDALAVRHAMKTTVPNEPPLSLDEAKAVVATKQAPRVTEESISAKIKNVAYMKVMNCGTLCVITMENGWVSTGFSAPASPENYDEEVGKRYAYDNAFKPLWQLEGYLLREQLFIQYEADR
jgi:hypothetical protein